MKVMKEKFNRWIKETICYLFHERQHLHLFQEKDGKTTYCFRCGEYR